jgi:hypothetical protein
MYYPCEMHSWYAQQWYEAPSQSPPARWFRKEERMSFENAQPELSTVAAGNLLGIASAMTNRGRRIVHGGNGFEAGDSVTSAAHASDSEWSEL